MDWSLIIGAYAAAVSTAVAVDRIVRDRRADKREVRVICRRAVTAAPDGTAVHVVTLLAVNTGKRAVTVRSPGFRLASGNAVMILPRRDLGASGPTLLADGEAVEYFFDRGALDNAEGESGSIIIGSSVLDAEGNRYDGGYPT